MLVLDAPATGPAEKAVSLLFIYKRRNVIITILGNMRVISRFNTKFNSIDTSLKRVSILDMNLILNPYSLCRTPVHYDEFWFIIRNHYLVLAVQFFFPTLYSQLHSLSYDLCLEIEPVCNGFFFYKKSIFFS